MRTCVRSEILLTQGEIALTRSEILLAQCEIRLTAGEVRIPFHGRLTPSVFCFAKSTSLKEGGLT